MPASPFVLLDRFYVHPNTGSRRTGGQQDPAWPPARVAAAGGRDAQVRPRRRTAVADRVRTSPAPREYTDHCAEGADLMSEPRFDYSFTQQLIVPVKILP